MSIAVATFAMIAIVVFILLLFCYFYYLLSLTTMVRQLSPITRPRSARFVPVYNNERYGLLHIVIRHYRQFQQAIPALKDVIQRLPISLRSHFKDASFANSMERPKCLSKVASILAANQATEETQLLMHAQDLVADYLEAATKTTTLLQKSTTIKGKLRHHYEAKLAGADAELIIGTSNDVNYPIILTAFSKSPKRVVPTPPSSPCPLVEDGWTTVPPKIKKYF